VPAFGLRTWRRFFASAAALASAVLLGLPVAIADASPPSLPGVVAGLQRSPVYLDPRVASPHIDVGRLLPVVPPGTYFASLPRSALSATGDPAAVPALLSSRVGRGGTFIVLLDGRLYGASTTVPGRLGGELSAAQSALPANGGDATAALIALMRSLTGSGDLQDAVGPDRAGGPVGAGVLVGMALAIVLGALALWWWLRRTPRRRRARPAPPRDLVEIDHAGRIIRRIPAKDRER
jgi:hypothetical protein